MNSVNIQIQRTISDAISNQILPQIQNVKCFRVRVRPLNTKLMADRPELKSEACRNERIRSNLRCEPVRDYFIDKHHKQANDNIGQCPFTNLCIVPNFDACAAFLVHRSANLNFFGL